MPLAPLQCGGVGGDGGRESERDWRLAESVIRLLVGRTVYPLFFGDLATFFRATHSGVCLRASVRFLGSFVANAKHHYDS